MAFDPSSSNYWGGSLLTDPNLSQYSLAPGDSKENSLLQKEWDNVIGPKTPSIMGMAQGSSSIPEVTSESPVPGNSSQTKSAPISSKSTDIMLTPSFLGLPSFPKEDVSIYSVDDSTYDTTHAIERKTNSHASEHAALTEAFRVNYFGDRTFEDALVPSPLKSENNSNNGWDSRNMQSTDTSSAEFDNSSVHRSEDDAASKGRRRSTFCAQATICDTIVEESEPSNNSTLPETTMISQPTHKSIFSTPPQMPSVTFPELQMVEQPTVEATFLKRRLTGKEESDGEPTSNTGEPSTSVVLFQMWSEPESKQAGQPDITYENQRTICSDESSSPSSRSMTLPSMLLYQQSSSLSLKPQKSITSINGRQRSQSGVSANGTTMTDVFDSSAMDYYQNHPSTKRAFEDLPPVPPLDPNILHGQKDSSKAKPHPLRLAQSNIDATENSIQSSPPIVVNGKVVFPGKEVASQEVSELAAPNHFTESTAPSFGAAESRSGKDSEGTVPTNPSTLLQVRDGPRGTTNITRPATDVSSNVAVFSSTSSGAGTEGSAIAAMKLLRQSQLSAFDDPDCSIGPDETSAFLMDTRLAAERGPSHSKSSFLGNHKAEGSATTVTKIRKPSPAAHRDSQGGRTDKAIPPLPSYSSFAPTVSPGLKSADYDYFSRAAMPEYQFNASRGPIPSSGTFNGSTNPNQSELSADGDEKGHMDPSFTSLPEMILRATTLASNLKDGRTASRLVQYREERHASSGLKRVPSAFLNHSEASNNRLDLSLIAPPQPRFIRDDTASISGRSSNTLTPGVKSEFDPDSFLPIPKKPLWRRPVFVVICSLIVFLVVMAAVLVPVGLFVIKKDSSPSSDGREASVIASHLSECRAKLTCQNGGSVMVVSADEEARSVTCACLCPSMYSGLTCEVQNTKVRSGEQSSSNQSPSAAVEFSTEDTSSTDSSNSIADGPVCATVLGSNGPPYLGIQIPDVVDDAKNRFGLPLNAQKIADTFSIDSISCTLQNSLIDLKAPSRRYPHSGDVIRDFSKAAVLYIVQHYGHASAAITATEKLDSALSDKTALNNEVNVGNGYVVVLSDLVIRHPDGSSIGKYTSAG